MKRFISLMMVVASSYMAGCDVNMSPGDGSKVGMVVKMSSQGLLNKTYEAQLIRGGITGGSGSIGGAPFDFTIESPAVAAKVQEYMESQTEVLLKYRMDGVYALWNTESGGHYLVDITPTSK